MKRIDEVFMRTKVNSEGSHEAFRGWLPGDTNPVVTKTVAGGKCHRKDGVLQELNF